MKNGLHVVSYEVVKKIVADIKKLPGGYVFWKQVPSKGKRSTTVKMRKWAKEIDGAFLTQELIEVMVKSCFTEQGLPIKEAKELRGWLIYHLFHKREVELYRKWQEVVDLELRKEQVEQLAKQRVK